MTNKEFREGFAKEFKERFEKMNVTQKRFSDLSGVPYYKVNAYLNGKYLPAGEDLRNIAKTLDCTIEELFGVHTNWNNY